VDWIHLAQDRAWWWALVNTVMNFLVPQKGGNFLICCELLASQEGFCSMELGRSLTP
jgi:hypothetical protein